MRCKFLFLIFQNGKVDEEKETIQEFADTAQLAQAIVKFAASESPLRLNPSVTLIYDGEGPSITLPRARQGYGPATNVVIKEVTVL